MRPQVDERQEMARRCAWCMRFWVGDAWIPGRRAGDNAILDATTHTICEDCAEQLRHSGLSL